MNRARSPTRPLSVLVVDGYPDTAASLTVRPAGGRVVPAFPGNVRPGGPWPAYSSVPASRRPARGDAPRSDRLGRPEPPPGLQAPSTHRPQQGRPLRL